MSYAVMAHVTDYDVWHETEEAVTVETVIRVLLRNAEVAKQAVANSIDLLREAGPTPQFGSLQHAIITDRGQVRPDVIDKLDLLVGRYFD
jgi:5'-methylthioadenosine phosphorylase